MDFALAGLGLGSGGYGCKGGAAGGGLFGGDVVEIVGEFGAADVGWAVWVGVVCWRGRGLRGEEEGGEEDCGGKKIAESHRAALIHPGVGEVKSWSYQF